MLHLKPRAGLAHDLEKTARFAVFPLGGQQTQIDDGLGVVGHDIEFRAAADRPDAEGGMPEHGVGNRFEMGSQSFGQSKQSGRQLGDGILTPLRARAVRGAACGGDPGGDVNLVLEDDLKIGRLTDNNESKPLALGQSLGAVLPGLLAHQPGKPNFVGQLREDSAALVQRPKHRGHGTFGIARPATVKFSPANFSTEGINAHARHAHGVGMGGEKQARLARGAGKTRHDIRPPRMHLVESRLGAEFAEKTGEVFRAGLLARAVGSGVAVGIDAGNAHQRLGQFFDTAGGGTHRGPVNLEKTSRASERDPRSKRKRACSPPGHSRTRRSAKNFCSSRATGEPGGRARGRFE